MATNICSLCNTELIDNLISCSGRCSKFFHYTCVGMTRTTFDVYKKVEGLRWQCSECINEFKGIWGKLDDLTTMVNEIKSMINLCGLVKSAVTDVLRDLNPTIRSPDAQPAKHLGQHNVITGSKRRKSKRKRNTMSSTPVNAGINHTAIEHQIPLPHESSVVSSNDTIIATNANTASSEQSIRTADTRTYLWLNGFHHETTTNQIVNLVAKTMDINESDIICRSLKSGKRSYTEFDQVSFRVGLKSTDLKDALTTKKWPRGVICKSFNSKNYNKRQPVILG